MSSFRQIKKHIVIIDDMRYNLITVFYLGEAGVMRNIFGLFTKKNLYNEKFTFNHYCLCLSLCIEHEHAVAINFIDLF